MNVDLFIKTIDSMFHDYSERIPRLKEKVFFRPFKDKIPGLSNLNVATLLNTAASLLPENEVYYEVGCFTGLTLFSAFEGNETKRFYACDSLPPLPDYDLHKLFWEHKAKYDSEDRIIFYEKSCWDVPNLENPFDRPIGVYFFDGPHDYQDHIDAFLKYEKFLADEALIIIDDTNYPQVSQAIIDVLNMRTNLNLLSFLPSNGMGEESWWNGIGLFKYKR